MARAHLGHRWVLKEPLTADGLAGAVAARPGLLRRASGCLITAPLTADGLAGAVAA
ncbi:hypothetical protein OOK58_38445 [Streptomyces sp. NBC_01728]|uniref:hypothetical protein n=1 Tax=unclassified Streptomyces TaxID=2593676 RepID=UPI00224E020B|nr:MULTISPECIES: hypothetical protein [unclassified Streptomyces]MCX4457832.1 hypothetical protein [Streptomyces sp. NBC_01719]MCX4497189.1 hypothetical protein [Streptomyces sp. NBC_01728]